MSSRRVLGVAILLMCSLPNGVTAMRGEHCNATAWSKAHILAYCGEGGLCGRDGTCWCKKGWWHNPYGDAGVAGGWCVEKPSELSHVSSFCGACLLLVLGKLTRVFCGPIQKLYLPSSVIGGVYGIIFVSAAKTSPTFFRYVTREWLDGWLNQASFLINIAFASPVKLSQSTFCRLSARPDAGFSLLRAAL